MPRHRLVLLLLLLLRSFLDDPRFVTHYEHAFVMNQLFWALFVRREPSFVYAFTILLDFEVLVVVSRWDVLLLI